MDKERNTPPPAQQALPFDDEADHPVPYALTVRARREVAPDALPDLEVVSSSTPAPMTPGASPRRRPDVSSGRNHAGVARTTGRSGAPRPDVTAGTADGALDEPVDTRPARARALRRAGVGPAQIARQLQVDELSVRAWVGDLGGRAGAPPTPGDAVVSLPGVPATSRRRDPAVRRRARAREQGRLRLRQDAGFAAGLGLLVGAAQLEEHGVGLRTTDPRIAAAALAWLRDYGELAPERVRVVLRLGRAVAGDRARHTWSETLGLPLEQLTHTRWRNAPDDDAVEALLHATDEKLAARLAGWADAYFEPAPTPVDAAF